MRDATAHTPAAKANDQRIEQRLPP